VIYKEIKKDIFESVYLNREVVYHVILPKNIDCNKTYPLLILNDGQDSVRVNAKKHLEKFSSKNAEQLVIAVGVYANEKRLYEYGISNQADYLNRGNLAANYAHFLIEEFLPFLQSLFPIEPQNKENVIAGYSMGGLSAFDVAWHYPNYFGKVGCFSGSFWWRSKKWRNTKNCDNHRIAINLILKTKKVPAHLKFWFQAGTKDEDSDRNNNGIIDAIDDTLDVVTALAVKGFRPYYDVKYLEVLNGEHNPETWSEAFPDFLSFAFNKGS